MRRRLLISEEDIIIDETIEYILCTYTVPAITSATTEAATTTSMISEVEVDEYNESFIMLISDTLDDDETKICHNISNISKMYIDDTEITPTIGYVLSEGEHEAKIYLEDKTTISESMFIGCSRLKNITIPSSVKTIQKYAFDFCWKLETFNFSTCTVTSIGDFAFDNCLALEVLNFNNALTNIGNGSFYHCSNISTITLPENLISLGDRSFGACSNLTSVTIESRTLQHIGINPFKKCYELTQISINSNNPYFTTTNGKCIFENATGKIICGLSSYPISTIPNNVKIIGDSAFDGILTGGSIQNGTPLTKIEDWAFAYCDITAVNTLNNVTEIGNYAFMDNSLLSSIVMGDKVQSVGMGAFYNCGNLKNIKITTAIAPTIHGNTFYGISSGATLSYPSGSDYSTWIEYMANSDNEVSDNISK